MATSTAARYSHGKPDAGEHRNFPWEYPVPDNKFWNDLPFYIGRNFLSNFSAEDIEQLPIDPDSGLEKNQKLELLDGLLYKRLAAQDSASASKDFYDVDYAGWDKLWFRNIHHTARAGTSRAEQTIRTMCDRRKDKAKFITFPYLGGFAVC